jgi:PrtD family type I secretion system ABC transporter
MAGFIDRFLNSNAKLGEHENPVSQLLKQCKKSFVFVALLTMVIEVLSITPIIFMWNLFDRVISSRSGVTLVSLGVLVLVAYGFWSALEWIRTRMMIRISLRIDWDIAAKVFDTSFRRYVARKEVDVHQVMEDVVRLRQFLTGGAILAMMSAPFAVVFIFVGWAFHPYLAVFIFVATLLQFLAAFTTSRITTPALREANTAASVASRLAAQTLNKSNTALALGMLKPIRKKWFSKHQHFLAMQVNASESAGLVGGFVGFMAHALPSMQLALGAFLVIQGEITGGMMIAAAFLLSRSIGPIKEVMSSWPSIQAAKQSLERLNQIVAEDEDQTARMVLPAPTGLLVVEDLIIQSGQAKPILNQLNFTLEPGQVLGVIGATASGKTSLTRALVGLWYPTSGHIRLDGADIAPWIRDDLGSYIGYAPLECDLFEGTLAENIARLGPVDPEKVVAATKAVGIHETILSFPKGYETLVSETGQVLTGGQRQRIAIARAIYGDPVYLVMDEPNASMDDAGEAALIRLIKSLKLKKTTVVFTTHRLKLLAAADVMMVLKNGQQLMFGPTQEVVNALNEKRESLLDKQKKIPAQTTATDASATAASAVTSATASTQSDNETAASPGVLT